MNIYEKIFDRLEELHMSQIEFAKVNKVSVTVASMYGLSIFDFSHKEKLFQR